MLHYATYCEYTFASAGNRQNKTIELLKKRYRQSNEFLIKCFSALFNSEERWGSAGAKSGQRAGLANQAGGTLANFWHRARVCDDWRLR
jgi:hypothetical protein